MSLFTKQPSNTDQSSENSTADQPDPTRQKLPLEMQATNRDRRLKSVIGPDLQIDGNLVCKGFLDISGVIIGDISADTLTVTDSGQISGKIDAKHVNSSGQMRGQVFAEDCAFTSGSTTSANISCQRITVQSGAMVEGHILSKPK